MISAEEARKMSRGHSQADFEAVMARVEVAIVEAAEKGRQSTEVEMTERETAVIRDVMGAIKNQGYNVATVTKRSGPQSLNPFCYQPTPPQQRVVQEGTLCISWGAMPKVERDGLSLGSMLADHFKLLPFNGYGEPL